MCDRRTEAGARRLAARGARAAAFFFVFIFLSNTADAASLDVYGWGKRCLGMGNACTATASGQAALHANPALLGFDRYAGISLDLGWSSPRLWVDRAPDETWPTLLPGDNLDLGLAYTSPLGSFFQRRVTIGFALVAPVVGYTSAGSMDYRSPQFPLYDAASEMLAALVGVGWRVLPSLSVGAGLSVLGYLKGTSAVEINLGQQEVVRKNVRMDIIPSAAVYAGLAWRPGDWLTLAASYQGALAVDYDLPIGVLVTEVGYLTYRLWGSSLYVPHRLNLGAAAALLEGRLTLAADFKWLMWSRMPQLSSRIYMVLDDETLKEPGQPTADLMHLEAPGVPHQARDSWEAHLGAEWLPWPRLPLRLGYLYRATPYPRQAGVTNYLDRDAHGLTLGLGWAPGGGQQAPGLHLDLAWEVLLLGSERVTKRDPLDPRPTYRFGGWTSFLGLSLRRDW
jgi:hypothetical protein